MIQNRMNRAVRAANAASELLRHSLRGYAEVKSLREQHPVGDHGPGEVHIAPESGEAIRIKLRVRGGTRDHGEPTDALTVWVLDHASARLRENLRKKGESYVDLGGAVHLRLPGLVVDRSDLEPASAALLSDEGRNPFADRASRIARTLLAFRRAKQWTVKQLSEAAQVSYSTAWYATRELQALDLISVDRGQKKTSITLKDPRLLIREWVSRYRWTKNRILHYHAPVGDPSRFLKRLPKQITSGFQWALTLQAGAHLIAPHATWDRIYFYLGTDAEEDVLMLGSDLSWEPGEDGRLGIMIPYYKDSVWAGLANVGGLPVVSPVQLVLDLWHYPVRGREQAEHLIETVLAREWNEA